jgi:hypothetical protein
VPPAPLSSNEKNELTQHFHAIDRNGMDRVRVLATQPNFGVFTSGAIVIDALALAWTGGKGGGPDAWAAFVREFIGEDFATLRDSLRNPGLHNLSAAADVVFTSATRTEASTVSLSAASTAFTRKSSHTTSRRHSRTSASTR